MSVSIDLGNAESFIFFEEDFMRISVGAGETDKQTQPVFDVTLTLTDDHYFDPLSQNYYFKLVIVKDYEDPIVEIIEEAKKKQVIYEYGEERVYDLTATSTEELTSASAEENLTVLYYSPLRLKSESISELTGVVEQTEEELLDEIANPTPVPYMDDFSEDGVATLKFNTPVKVPSVTEVLDSRVALRMTKAITSNDPIYETYETADGLADF